MTLDLNLLQTMARDYPNLRAANEHLHKQLKLKDKRIAELEAEVRGLRVEADDSEGMAKHWHRKFQELYALLNGEAE